MKKGFLLLCLSLFAVSMYAQNYEKSLGLRGGRPLGLTYKQFVTTNNAVEGIIDLDIFTKNMFKLGVSGFYLWEWNLANVQGLDWFVGPGASAMLALVKDADSVFDISINGSIGLEYKFAGIPLALAVDYSPRLSLLHDATFGWDYCALSIRYTW
ncbi:MAG: hypothetical protein LBF90_04905 [Prevotellaceae bacterium]|nr:hypothetical protein [Prevotellaceae bacterium]